NPLGELSQASDMGWSLLDGAGDPSLQGALEWFGQFRHPQWEDPDTGQPTGQVTPGILLLRGAAEALAGNVVLQELLGRLMEVGTDRTIGKTYVVLSEDADPPLSLESMVLPLVHGLPGPAQLDKLI